MTKPLSDDLIISKEAETILGVDRYAVLRMVKTGKLVFARKLYGRTGAYMFNRADVERLAAERRAELEAQIARIGAA